MAGSLKVLSRSLAVFLVVCEVEMKEKVKIAVLCTFNNESLVGTGRAV